MPASPGRDRDFLLKLRLKVGRSLGASRSREEPDIAANVLAVVVFAEASRTVLALVKPEISLVGERERFLVSCSIRKESRIADAAGSISQISAMILRAFSRVRIAIVFEGGICGIMVSM